MKNRGVNKTAEEFFKVDRDCVNSPHNLDFIDDAVEMYLHHIKNNSKIAVLVDVDVDGFTSAALLINYTNLQKKFGDWQESTCELVPVFHQGKIHGLDDTEMMRRIRDEVKPDLFVIPDASGSKAQYKALTDLGIDILVLDHHDTEEKGFGNEKVVVVNNQHSYEYTNKDFSGVGIVWQFCRALDEVLTFVCADNFIDLVAVGNIGDVMDMRSDETRYLCNLGMSREYINSQLIQFLRASAYSMRDGKYNPHTISFNVVPYFNAVCRIGEMSDKEMLFKCLIDEDALTMVQSGKRGHSEDVLLVEEGWRLATNAKGRQDTRKNKLADMVDKVINEEALFGNQVIVLAFDDFKEEYRALSGLTCNKLIEVYDRPVILAFKNEDGSYSGSVRAPDNIPAYANFRKQCLESRLFKYASGHPLAFGVGFNAGMAEAITEYFNDKYSNMDVSLNEKVDFIFDADDPEICDVIEELAMYENIWGQNLEAPVIAIKNVKLSPGKMSLVGGKKNTLKIAYPWYELINFNSSETEYNSLKLPYDGVEQYYTATIVCHSPTINEYGNNRTPQLQFSNYILGDVRYEF